MCVCVCVSLQKKAQRSESKAEQGDVTDDVMEGGAGEAEGEWVEYVDSFGRTRRCLKEDLEHMRTEDKRRRERLGANSV